ncbi:MAG: O-antigen ligase family protein, partial [Fluviicola sp.]
TLLVFFIIPKLSNFGLIFLLLLFITGLIKRQLTFQWNKPLFFGTLLYCSYAIGCFFTFDSNDRAHYLESKLSFVLIPLLFSISFKEFKPNFKLVIIFLWSSILFATILCFFHALSLTIQETNGESPFFGVYYSYIHHPTYWVAMTQIVLLFTVVATRKFHLNLSWLFFLGAILLVLINTYLSGSLAGVIGLLICFCLLFLYKLVHWIGWLKSLAFGFICSIAFFLVLLNVGFVKTAIKPIKVEFGSYFENPQQFVREKLGSKTGDQKRMIMWWVAIELIQENQMGVGTGNVDFYTTKKLNTYQQFELAKEELNPHNQFLQIGVELGILGIVLLLIIFLAIIISGIINKDLFIFSIGSIMFVNALFESILQKSSGIFFFTFMLSLSFFLIKNKSNFIPLKNK